MSKYSTSNQIPKYSLANSHYGGTDKKITSVQRDPANKHKKVKYIYTQVSGIKFVSHVDSTAHKCKHEAGRVYISGYALCFFQLQCPREGKSPAVKKRQKDEEERE